MLDLHTHALPLMDDGAKSIERGIDMLSYAYSQGVTKCALTSHCTLFMQEDIELFLSKRKKCFEEFSVALKETKEMLPELILGAEIYADHDISRYEGLEKLCYEGTNYILLELPVDKKREWLPDCVRQIKARGLNVVIAHLDRYNRWEEVIRDLDGMNIIYQLNASRLETFKGRMLIKKILKNNEKFFVSSDMHNMSTRRTYMKEAYTYLSKKYGSYAEDLFINNALDVLS